MILCLVSCCSPGGDREEDEDGERDRERDGDVTTSPHCSELPPSSGGGPRVVTPAMLCEWGQQQLIPCTGLGKLPWAVSPNPGDAGRAGKSLMDQVGVTLCVGQNSPKALLHQQGPHITASKGAGGKERKGKREKIGLSILWEHPEFLLLPRLLQCPFLWQGGMQH